MIDNHELKTLMKALYFAAEKHRDQRRKDELSSPYINHPISLANILINEAQVTDIDVICSALLHDTIEDTAATEDELMQEFGEAITTIVMEVTDDKSLKKQERKQAQVDHAATISDKAKLVKLADKISNLRDVAQSPPTDWPLERRQAYFDWANEVINRLRGVHDQLELLFDEAYSQKPGC